MESCQCADIWVQPLSFLVPQLGLPHMQLYVLRFHTLGDLILDLDPGLYHGVLLEVVLQRPARK